MLTGKNQQQDSKKDRKRPKQVLYWDTCVILAWLKGEKRRAGEMEALNELAKLVNKKEVAVITSVLTRAEVLDSKISKATLEKYRGLFRRTNFQHVALDLPIAKLTSEIRDFYNDTDFELLTPDAIHLATAIHYGVFEFHTFDGSKKCKPRNRAKKDCGLLKLDGSVAGRSLRIRKPSSQQFDLLLNVPPLEDKAEEDDDEE